MTCFPFYRRQYSFRNASKSLLVFLPLRLLPLSLPGCFSSFCPLFHVNCLLPGGAVLGGCGLIPSVTHSYCVSFTFIADSPPSGICPVLRLAAPTMPASLVCDFPLLLIDGCHDLRTGSSLLLGCGGGGVRGRWVACAMVGVRCGLGVVVPGWCGGRVGVGGVARGGMWVLGSWGGWGGMSGVILFICSFTPVSWSSQIIRKIFFPPLGVGHFFSEATRLSVSLLSFSDSHATSSYFFSFPLPTTPSSSPSPPPPPPPPPLLSPGRVLLFIYISPVVGWAGGGRGAWERGWVGGGGQWGGGVWREVGGVDWSVRVQVVGGGVGAVGAGGGAGVVGIRVGVGGAACIILLSVPDSSTTFIVWLVRCHD